MAISNLEKDSEVYNSDGGSDEHWLRRDDSFIDGEHEGKRHCTAKASIRDDELLNEIDLLDSEGVREGTKHQCACGRVDLTIQK